MNHSEWIQKDWSKFCVEHLNSFANTDELLFLRNSKLDFESLNNITLSFNGQCINIIDFKFEHHLSFEPFPIFDLIDDFFLTFFSNMELNKATINPLNEEQRVLVVCSLKFLSKFVLKKTHVPFFYSLKQAQKGLQEAKRTFNPNKSVSFEDYRNHVIHKMLACGLSKQYSTNLDKIMV